MTAAEVMKQIEARGGRKVRQKGSHIRVECACRRNKSTVPDHGGHDLAIGTLKSIQRKLASCPRFGEGWLGV